MHTYLLEGGGATCYDEVQAAAITKHHGNTTGQMIAVHANCVNIHPFACAKRHMFCERQQQEAGERNPANAYLHVRTAAAASS